MFACMILPGLGSGQFCVYLQIPNCNSLTLWMLNPPLTVCLCGVILFCHGALEYWDGKTNWGKGMKDVFLKKLTGKQASVSSFPALILPLMTYVFPCGSCCRGTGEDEAQENSCWSRCFRVSCPLTSWTLGAEAWGLEDLSQLYFWLPFIIIKTSRSL